MIRSTPSPPRSNATSMSRSDALVAAGVVGRGGWWGAYGYRVVSGKWGPGGLYLGDFGLGVAALRDDARAPFMLALIALAMAIGLRPRAPRQLVALCALYGALTGIGSGVRPDVIVQLPLIVITVILFVPSASVRTKAAAL